MWKPLPWGNTTKYDERCHPPGADRASEPVSERGSAGGNNLLGYNTQTGEKGLHYIYNKYKI